MSISIRERVEQSWLFLEQPSERGDFDSREIDVTTASGPVTLAVGAAGSRHLLIPVPPDSKFELDDRSEAVQIVRVVLLDGDERKVFVDLRCQVPRLQRMFSQLVTAVLERLIQHEDPVTTCSGVLGEWRELVEAAQRRLSEATIIGVFGELCQVEQLALHDPSAAIDAWRGPENSPQDIVGPHGAIEVKSKVSKSRFIRINGIDQLATDLHSNLILIVQLLARRSNGRSLVELLERLVVLGVSRSLLLDKVGLLGIDLGDPLATDRRYVVDDELAFNVNDGFPRITSEELRSPISSAIARVSYDLDLNQLDRWRIPKDQLGMRRKKVLG